MFKERFRYILNVLKDWATDENDWIRNAAAFAVHAGREKNIKPRRVPGGSGGDGPGYGGTCKKCAEKGGMGSKGSQ